MSDPDANTMMPGEVRGKISFGCWWAVMQSRCHFEVSPLVMGIIGDPVSGFETDLWEEKMLGVSIGRLADRDPGATSVVVRLGYSAVTHEVDWVLFDKSAVNEVVAVVRNRWEDEKHVFVVIDVEKSFCSQSLCVLSETSVELEERELWSILMYRKAGCRCFIGRATAMLGTTPYCVKFSEDDPEVIVLPQTQNVKTVSQLSSHLFAVVTTPQIGCVTSGTATN
ncbi:hypothetical protein Pelo_17550 [Pelomyxa schiedti]|nr:hypothetical protein Pelo_17550 [Pelomyxa schiedti]